MKQTGNYYYGARYYNPKWSTWLSVDPLAEEFASWSSYNYAFSNPLKFTDPTGMGPEIADWEPEINKDGSTSYIAEKNDSVDTFAAQYGVTKDQARSLIKEDKVIEGTVVSGDDVLSMNPYDLKKSSSALKLNLNSKMATSQRKLDQIFFSFDHSKSLGGSVFASTSYFSDSSLFIEQIDCSGKICLNGELVDVVASYPFRRSSGVFFNTKYYPWYLGNKPVNEDYSSGRMFNGRTSNIEFNQYSKTNSGKLGYQGRFWISTHQNNSGNLYQSLSKDIPVYFPIINNNNMKK